MAETSPDRQRLKLWLDSDVLDQAAKRAEAQSSEVRRVTVADIARAAIFEAARRAEGTEAERDQIASIKTRASENRRRWPLTVARIPYQAARSSLREVGVSVVSVVEDGLIAYVQEGRR